MALKDEYTIRLTADDRRELDRMVVAYPYCRGPVVTQRMTPTPSGPAQAPDAFEGLDDNLEPERRTGHRQPGAGGGGRGVWVAVGLLVTGAAVAGTISLLGGKNAGPDASAVESELPASPIDGILDKLEAGQRQSRNLKRKATESQKAVDAATTTAEQAEATARRFAGLTKDGGLDLIEDARKARQRVTELTRQHALNAAAMKAEAERMEQLGREFTAEYQVPAGA